jgi:hypothetical protein
MKRRNLALTVVLVAVFATLALLKVSGTINAQINVADKAVMEVKFDRGDAYPNMGTQITLPFVIHPGQPQTLISVTSMDQLLSIVPPGPLPNSQVAFYADIPLGCSGRWWDPGNHFTHDVYSVNGQPTAEPLSPAQLGTPVPTPAQKVAGDQDVDPPVLAPGLPVPGQTFEVDLHFQTVEYGPPEVVGPAVPITRFFDFHCDTAGKYVFWFCNKIEPLPPYTDPSFAQGLWPDNNVLCAPFQVTASTGVGGIAEAPDVAASPVETGGGSSAATYAMAGGAAALLVVLAAGGWYARRRLRAG